MGAAPKIVTSDLPFAKLDVVVSFPGRVEKVTAFVSESSILQIADYAKHPKLLGHLGSVTVAGLRIPIRFVSEASRTSVCYNAKLLFENESQRKTLREYVQKHRAAAPLWERKYPRFGVKMVADRGAVYPVHAVLRLGNHRQYPRIINFTLTGVLVEGQGEELRSLKIEHRYPLELQLSDGSLVTALEGTVVRINEDFLRAEPRMFRQVAFEMSKESQNNFVYKTLIRNALEAVRGLR